MRKFNKQLLFTTMSVQSESYNMSAMQDYILRHVDKMPNVTWTVDYMDNIYITKSDGTADLYPCVVAHMDTVHKVLPKSQFSIISHDDTWFAFNPVKRELTGIGGDDKVGIFVALSMLEWFDNVKLAFFVDEEVGCRGSSRADLNFFNDTSFVLQCDRRGYGEFVQEIYGTELFGDAFKGAVTPILETYGFKAITHGGITDVGELKERDLGVAAANISCGYYLPHTDREYIVIPEVEAVTHMVGDIIEQLGDVQWTHYAPYLPYTTRTTGKWAAGGWNTLDDTTTSPSDARSYTYGWSGSQWANDFYEDGWDDVPKLDSGTKKDDEKQETRRYLTDVDCPMCYDSALYYSEVLDDYICEVCGTMLIQTLEEQAEQRKESVTNAAVKQLVKQEDSTRRKKARTKKVNKRKKGVETNRVVVNV